MGVFTTIGWLMRGAVVYVLYWAFGYIVAGCIVTPRPVPLSILLLVTAGAVSLAVVAVRKEYRMHELDRYREWKRQGDVAREIQREADEEHEDWMWNPANLSGYWRMGRR